MKKASLYFFMFIFIMYFSTVGVQLVWKTVTGVSRSANMLIAASAVYSVLLLVLFLWRGWAVLSPAWFRKSDKAILFWAGIAALGTIVPFTWLQEFLPELDEGTAETYRSIAQAPLGYVTLCLFAPFVEEVVFRGAILRSLLSNKMKPWTAIILSAALFAVVHLNPAQMPHAFIIGLLLGWMYCRTGSILPGVTLHWVNNTVVYALIVLAPQLENMTLIQIFGSNTRIALAVGCSFCILLPALYQIFRIRDFQD